VLCGCPDGVVPVSEPEGEVVVFAAVPGETPEGHDVFIVGEPSQDFSYFSSSSDVEPLELPEPVTAPAPPPKSTPRPVVVVSAVAVEAPPPEPTPVEVGHEDHSIQQEVYERTREVDQVTSDSLEVLNKLRAKKHLPPIGPTPLDIPEVPPEENAPAPPSKD
jgi:hypothetical protein